MYLTRGERFWLWGRRWGKKGTDLAKIYSVDPGTITTWIHGRKNHLAPEVALTEPIEKWEMMSIARRRVGRSVRAQAKIHRISHVTMITREKGRGGWRECFEWWRKAGWPSPPSVTGVAYKQRRGVSYKYNKGGKNDESSSAKTK